MSPYAKLHRELNRNTNNKRHNRTVLQIVKRILNPIRIASLCEFDDNTGTYTLRNDVLARAFLLRRAS
jgi:hypothetical protein